MTYIELITAAYRKLGIAGEGETLSAQMKTDAKQALHLMLEEWENDPDLALTEQQTFATVAGTESYVIGDGQTWDGNKPLTIQSAYTTVSRIDYPLTIIAEKEYMEIDTKDDSGTPDRIMYVQSDLTGTVYLYPSPSAVGTVTLLSSRAFNQVTDLTADVELPSGYKSALLFNLAIALSPEYPDVKINQIVIAKAVETLDMIKMANRKRPVPIKFNFLGRRRGIFNINTGY